MKQRKNIRKQTLNIAFLGIKHLYIALYSSRGTSNRPSVLGMQQLRIAYR